jgi:hypothetical protein
MLRATEGGDLMKRAAHKARLRVLHTLVHSVEEASEILADLRAIAADARRQRQSQVRYGSGSPWWFFPNQSHAPFLAKLVQRTEALDLVVEDLRTIVEEIRRQRPRQSRHARPRQFEVLQELLKRSPELVEGGVA